MREPALLKRKVFTNNSLSDDYGVESKSNLNFVISANS